MVVNFEFLGTEPIENIITCMNFKIDKVVFFGFDKVIQEQSKYTKDFLTKKCHVQEVRFISLAEKDIQKELNTMREAIQKEIGEKNKIYFDITGGESLVLVAFGMLSKEFETPMHMYDIRKNALIELDEGAKLSISKDVETQKIKLTIDSLIKLKGGVINKKMAIKDKNPNNISNDEIKKLYEIASKHRSVWNKFASLIAIISNQKDLQVSKKVEYIRDYITPNSFGNILTDLREKELINNLNIGNGAYKFRFKDERIKNILSDAGCILELYTYLTEKEESQDCQIGVHIDWDGVIHAKDDVVNEVDVISLKGNIITFISCKNGKLDQLKTLHAFYELETLAQRFGGKYSKKVLVTSQNFSQVNIDRAKEMGIEVR